MPARRYRVSIGDRTFEVEVDSRGDTTTVTLDGQRLPADLLPADASGLRRLRVGERVYELLLAQSSDWAFLMKTGTAREYATQRTIDHLARFNRLHDQFVANMIDEEFLRDCEWRDNLFPNVNWRYYA